MMKLSKTTMLLLVTPQSLGNALKSTKFVEQWTSVGATFIPSKFNYVWALAGETGLSDSSFNRIKHLAAQRGLNKHFRKFLNLTDMLAALNRQLSEGLPENGDAATSELPNLEDLVSKLFDYPGYLANEPGTTASIIDLVRDE